MMLFNSDVVKESSSTDLVLILAVGLFVGYCLIMGKLTTPTEQEGRDMRCARNLMSVVSGGATATQGELVISGSLTYREMIDATKTMCSTNEDVTFSGQSSISKLQGVLSE